MDSLFFIGVPAIILTSYIIIKRSNITKETCIQYSLDTIESIHDIYTCVSHNVNDIIDSYTKTHYKELEIITKKNFKNDTTEIVYNYNDQLFNIIYDTTYPIRNSYNVGDIIDNKDVLTSTENNKIVLIEFIYNETNKTMILNKIVNDYIIRLSGPNQDFYNRIDQPLYIIDTILDTEIIDNIDTYNIQVTYMNLNTIQKKIIII